LGDTNLDESISGSPFKSVYDRLERTGGYNKLFFRKQISANGAKYLHACSCTGLRKYERKLRRNVSSKKAQTVGYL
jgi:hypothetical protein